MKIHFLFLNLKSLIKFINLLIVFSFQLIIKIFYVKFIKFLLNLLCILPNKNNTTIISFGSQY